MNHRSSPFGFSHDRERQRIVCWNGGFPFIIDATRRDLAVVDLQTPIDKNVLLEWAAQNQVRCVGFEGDSRPPRGPFQILRRENTWACV